MKKWRYTLVLFTAHALLLGLVFYAVTKNHNIEDRGLWLVQYLIDFPSSLVIWGARADETMRILMVFALLGSLQWLLIGWVIDVIRSKLSSSNHLAEEGVTSKTGKV